jgi:hypothetical protein
MSGITSFSPVGLPRLLHMAWVLANLEHGDELDAHNSPVISFKPGIADRGTWVCEVEFRKRDGHCARVFGGTIDHCATQVREMLDRKLGLGYAPPIGWTP